MKIRGRWIQPPYFLLKERKYVLTIEVDKLPTIYEKTKDKDISVEISTWSEKRSLNANAYFHVLVNKIAASLHASSTEIHNWLISDYGCPDSDLGQISLEERIDWRRLDNIHLRPTAEYIFDEDLAFRKYYVMRGSHTYNTVEMARLIDGAVQEAKELGIETMTPDELERLKSAWQRK